MDKNSRIYVAGHRGLVGSAIARRLRNEGYGNLIMASHAQLDLTRQAEVEAFFEEKRPEYVFLAAAKVGGIGANSTYPADFIYENLAVSLHVIEAARRFGVRKLLNLGSSCIYPKLAPQPLKEEYLLTAPLEPTNEAYAVAKIAAIKQCRYYNEQHGTDFLSVMPTNLYGPGDNYDLQSSHVLPALIRKFYEAKVSGTDRVVLWGDGSPLREFLYVDDLAEAVVFLMENRSAAEVGELVNIGMGTDLAIRELANLLERVVYRDAPGRHCAIDWDTSKPNGTPKKLLDVSRMTALGWKARVTLEEGLALTYADFLSAKGTTA